MIDRVPYLEAAREAAASTLAGVEQLVDVETPAPATSSSDGEGLAELLAAREKLVALGSVLVHNLSTGAARRWGAHWVYDEQECKAVADAALDVAELYVGKLSGPWERLAVVLAATTLPRFVGPKLPPLVDSPASSSSGPAPAGLQEGQPAAAAQRDELA